MKMQSLLEHWQSLSRPHTPRINLHAELEYQDVARLRALAEMYPGCTVPGVMADLLHVALDELEAGLPYVHGRQIGEDECGDPVYEDIGPTPRFLSLTRKHLKSLQHKQSLAS